MDEVGKAHGTWVGTLLEVDGRAPCTDGDADADVDADVDGDVDVDADASAETNRPMRLALREALNALTAVVAALVTERLVSICTFSWMSDLTCRAETAAAAFMART